MAPLTDPSSEAASPSEAPLPPEARPPRWRRWAGTALSWLGTLLLALLAMQTVGWLRAPELPEQAPDFALRDLDGQTVSLADFRGQTVVVNFWATWCGPCRIEAPALARFAASHPDIPVLGLATDGPAAKVRATAQRIGADYPILLADRATADAYQVTTLPTTVVVGPDGEVRGVHVGLLTDPQIRWLVGVW